MVLPLPSRLRKVGASTPSAFGSSGKSAGSTGAAGMSSFSRSSSRVTANMPDMGAERRGAPGGRHVELQQVLVASHGQYARPGRETDAFAVQQYVRRSQGRMAAQIDFDRRREPAQVIIGIFAFACHGKGGFREIVLGGDGLESRIGQPFGERHDRSRIAGEWPVREGIDLEEGDRGHRADSVRSGGRMVSRSVWPSGSRWMMISVAGKRSHKACSARSSESWACFTD